MTDRLPREQPLFPEEMAGLELPPPIPMAEQEKLVDKLKHEYTTFKAAIAPLHEKIERWHELYESSSSKRKMFPWPDAANFNVPLIMATVDSIHARIIKAVFDVDPLWLGFARHFGSHEQAKKAEKYLDYWADEMNISTVLDMLSHNMLIEGTGVLKVDWARKSRQIPGVMHPETGQPGQPEEVVEYEGPNGYHVPLKDFILIPADSPTMEDAVYTGHRVWLTHEQLVDRGHQNFYFNVDLLLERQGDSTAAKVPQTLSSIVAGKTSDAKYEETNQYEIVEMFGPYDFGDGPVPSLMTFSPEHGILLRLEPYPYQYGRPPYIDFCVYPRPNFFWGRSVPEVLESAQEEITAMHNMRADALAIRIAPPIIRRSGAQWDPEETPWQPAQIIDAADPSEIFQLQLADVPSSLFAHEQDTLAFVERVTGMSDYFMGRSPTQNRTATEVNRVTSEGLARIDVMVSRFQKSGMRKLAWVLWWLLYQYRPFIDHFQVEGNPYSISKMEMRPSQGGQMPFEFRPHGELSDASKDARRQQKLMLFQAASQSLSQFYPDGIQQLLLDIFGDFEITNKHQILGPPWSVIQQQLQQAYQQGMQEGMQQGAQAAAQAQN